MQGRIRGTFPGGPSRAAAPPQRSGPPRLRRVSDIEERMTRRTLARTKRRRSRRVAVGLLAAVVVAGVVGNRVGKSSHRTQEELIAAERESHRRDFDISSEVNRTLLQLWKMEDVEAIRNLGRSR